MIREVQRYPLHGILFLYCVTSHELLSVTCSIANLDGLHEQHVAKNAEYREQIADLTALCAAKKDEVESERQHLIDYKKQVALAAVNSRSGKPIPPQASTLYCLHIVKYAVWWAPDLSVETLEDLRGIATPRRQSLCD